jgi:hypothetical protein
MQLDGLGMIASTVNIIPMQVGCNEGSLELSRLTMFGPAAWRRQGAFGSNHYAPKQQSVCSCLTHSLMSKYPRLNQIICTRNAPKRADELLGSAHLSGFHSCTR